MITPESVPRRTVRTIPIPTDLSKASFLAKVWLSDSADCWNWAAALDSRRTYGLFKSFHRTYQAHRVSYTLFREPIPEGLVIDHLCRNGRCVNPAHLEAVTAQVNAARSGNCMAAAARNWLNGLCVNGHNLQEVGLYKDTKYWRCAQCGRNRSAEYAARKRAKAAK